MGFKFGARSRAKLEGVHPDLILVVSLGLHYSPIDFAITEGKRFLERQRWLVKQGFSRTLNSKHLDGKALDVMCVGDINRDGVTDHRDKSLTWSREPYTLIAEAMQRAADELGIGIRWGGDWDGDGDSEDETFFDGPHFELKG